jgi:transcriptional regulator GlxA family with amidase domain
MKLSLLLFDGFTALDAIGGYEVLSRIPGLSFEIAAKERGLVATDTRAFGITAVRAFAEVETTDVLYVPGGPGVEIAKSDQALCTCIRRLHASSKWTLGVCNGVGLLAAAGVLEGKTVTTNWDYREVLAEQGIHVVPERYARDGKIVTSAGVSASIDAALSLAGLIAGEDVAKLIQLGIEYYPRPPFGGTSADDAPLAAREVVRKVTRASVAALGTTRPAF